MFGVFASGTPWLPTSPYPRSSMMMTTTFGRDGDCATSAGNDRTARAQASQKVRIEAPTATRLMARDCVPLGGQRTTISDPIFDLSVFWLRAYGAGAVRVDRQEPRAQSARSVAIGVMCAARRAGRNAAARHVATMMPRADT